jgi:polysaccharide pyruvyl transferase WcaK-like protein
MPHLRVTPFVPSVRDMLAFIRSCDVVVATRYHGLLLSIAQGVPVIGVSYHPKSFDLLEAVGLREFCVDIDTIDAPRLTALTERAWRLNGDLRRRIADRLPP